MFKFEWKVNGRTVAPNQVGRELTKSLQGEIVSRAKIAVARVRCPVHGSSPRNIRVSGSRGNLRFQYESCCDRLQQAVNNSFR